MYRIAYNSCSPQDMCKNISCSPLMWQFIKRKIYIPIFVPSHYIYQFLLPILIQNLYKSSYISPSFCYHEKGNDKHKKKP